MANSPEDYTPSEIKAIVAFVASSRTLFRYQRGERTRSVDMALYRNLWTHRNGFSWNRQVLAFEFRGTPVPPATVKQVVNAISLDARFQMLDATLKLQQAAQMAKRVEPAALSTWRDLFDSGIRRGVGAAGVLGHGGFDEMTPDNWRALAGRAQVQLEYRAGFEQRILTGEYGGDLSSGRLLQHAGSYTNSFRSVYENTRLDDRQEKLGHDLFWRVLGASDHCHTGKGGIGCVEAAAMGKVSRDEFVEIGECACGNGCNCIGMSEKG
jgi:hypothetical protein